MGPSSKSIVAEHGTSAHIPQPRAVKPALARVLMAATCAGLLASSMLLLNEKSTKHHSSDAAVLSQAAAQLLTRCAMVLPEVQKSLATPTLNRWSAPWLAANATLPEVAQQQAQDALCTQLLSASIQGPSDIDGEGQEDFATAMEETQTTMVEHIATQVHANPALAQGIAPLVGVESEDVESYLQSLIKKTDSTQQDSEVYPSV